jgi:hypothetical protein
MGLGNMFGHLNFTGLVFTGVLVLGLNGAGGAGSLFIEMAYERIKKISAKCRNLSNFGAKDTLNSGQ